MCGGSRESHLYEFKRDGRVMATRTVALDPDGRTMTSVMEGTLPSGENFQSIAVFEKQGAGSTPGPTK
jgi:hypothetical protein